QPAHVFHETVAGAIRFADADAEPVASINTNSFAKYGFDQNVVSFPGRGNSSYHGLALQVNRRFSDGLQFIGAYTWSHNIDDRTVVNPTGDPTKGTTSTALTNSAGKIVAYVAADPTAGYISAGLGAFGNAGRNTLPTRHIQNFDMSLTKKIAFTEKRRLEFSA